MGFINRLRHAIGMYLNPKSQCTVTNELSTRENLTLAPNMLILNNIPVNLAKTMTSGDWVITKMDWREYNALISYRELPNIIDIKFGVNTYSVRHTLRLYFERRHIADYMKGDGYSIPAIVTPDVKPARYFKKGVYSVGIPFDEKIFPRIVDLISDPYMATNATFTESFKSMYPNVFGKVVPKVKIVSTDLKVVDNEENPFSMEQGHKMIETLLSSLDSERKNHITPNLVRIEQKIEELKTAIAKHPPATESSATETPRVDLRKPNKSKLCIPEVIGTVRDILYDYLPEEAIMDIVGELEIKLHSMEV